MFMNYLDVCSQLEWLAERFSTRITFVVSLSLMQCLDVSSQISCFSNSFDVHELSWCESSDGMIGWKISHTNYNCNSFVLHELSWYVSLIFVYVQRFYNTYYTRLFSLLHEQFSHVYFYFACLKIFCHKIHSLILFSCFSPYLEMTFDVSLKSR